MYALIYDEHDLAKPRKKGRRFTDCFRKESDLKT